MGGITLNEKDAHSLSDLFVDAYVFINAHAKYYMGAIIGMLLDKKGWTNKKQIVKHLIAVLLLCYVSVEIMKLGGLPEHVILLVGSIIGLGGHPTARYYLEDALPRINKAITDKIIDIISKK